MATVAKHARSLLMKIHIWQIAVQGRGVGA